MKAGGFGLLPLSFHFQARQAFFAAALVLLSKPWAKIYAEILSTLPIFQHSPFHQLMLCNTPTCRPWAPTHIPNVSFLLDALYSPNPNFCLKFLPSLLPPAGDWCASIPIWHNPFILDGGGQVWRLPPPSCPQPPFLNPHRFRVDSLGHVIILDLFLSDQPLRGAPVPARWIMRPFQGPRGGHITAAALQHRAALTAEVQNLMISIPPAWRAAARTAICNGNLHPLAAARLQDSSVAILLQASGWQAPGQEALSLPRATVSTITSVYLSQHQAEKKDKLTNFILRTFGLPRLAQLPVPAWNADHALAFLGRLARLPCSNSYKEPLWLLAYNGVNIASRRLLSTPCPCSAHAPQDLAHVFWECPVALDLRQIVERPLRTHGMIPRGQHLQRHSLWLGHSPGRMAGWVWDLMCLLTIYAMDQGRRELATSTLLCPLARTAAATSRARTALYQAVSYIALTFRLNSHRKESLARASARLGQAHPFFEQSATHPQRIIISHTFHPP